MALTIEIEREDDGRWLAEVPQLPGVLVYGQNATRRFSVSRRCHCELSPTGWIMGRRFPI